MPKCDNLSIFLELRSNENQLIFVTFAIYYPLLNIYTKCIRRFLIQNDMRAENRVSNPSNKSVGNIERTFG